MRGFKINMAAAVCLALLLLDGCTNQTEQITVAPAFRPHRENASVLLNALKTARVAVYPTILRTSKELPVQYNHSNRSVSMKCRSWPVAA